MKLTIFLMVALVAGCSAPSGDVYTLYRNSLLDTTMRIHIATFDARESGQTYNQENCMLAAELFSRQQGVKTKFWCEKGGYKK